MCTCIYVSRWCSTFWTMTVSFLSVPPALAPLLCCALKTGYAVMKSMKYKYQYSVGPCFNNNIILDVGWQACGLSCIWINNEFKLWPHFHTWWVFTVLLTTESFVCVCVCVCVCAREQEHSRHLQKWERSWDSPESQTSPTLPLTEQHAHKCTHSDMYTAKHWVKLIKAFLGVMSADKDYTDCTSHTEMKRWKEVSRVLLLNSTAPFKKL